MSDHLKHAHLLKHPKLPKPDFAPIRHVLGEIMPSLQPGPRGRQRLVTALTQRFGEHFRTVEMAQKALAHFDSETDKVREFFVSQGAQNG